MTDVSDLYPLQQSLEIGSFVKMLVREVLSDRYGITQANFQYQGVEIRMNIREVETILKLCKSSENAAI